ncbi:acyl transferase/acyl hydrolase/lysophospholipase [Syncephalis plumigaleata]|nr:acyl transferase/acyl hydrolase/lysophospholipase [Syncephalis plumigaleata]
MNSLYRAGWTRCRPFDGHVYRKCTAKLPSTTACLLQRRLKTTQAIACGNIGLLFPGQGAQRVGMGKDIYEIFPSAFAVFQEADEALQMHLRDLIFDGPQNTLTLTENAQPAILVTSIAILRVLEKEFGFSVKDHASVAMGHSLGEYTALVAAGSLSLTDAVRLVRVRGLAMSATVDNHIKTPTAMSALVVKRNKLEALEEAMSSKIPGELKPGELAELANVNASFQAVLSGTTAGVYRASHLLQEWQLATRAVDLPVSAPFHCSLMAPAVDELRPALNNVSFSKPCITVMSNVTARPHIDPSTIADSLLMQVTSRVQWASSIEFCRQSRGVHDWLAIGPGRVLYNLVRKEHPLDHSRPVDTVHEIETIAKALNL